MVSHQDGWVKFQQHLNEGEIPGHGALTLSVMVRIEPVASQSVLEYGGEVPLDPVAKPKRKKAQAPAAPAPSVVFWNYFVQAVEKHHAIDYTMHRNATTSTQCKRLTDVYPLDKLTAAVDAYVTDRDPFYEKAGYPLGLFIAKLPLLIKKASEEQGQASVYDLLNGVSGAQL